MCIIPLVGGNSLTATVPHPTLQNINQSFQMLYPRIAGVASYVPDDILDNEMLSKMVDTSDEWITTRVGIKERRILKKMPAPHTSA